MADPQPSGQKTAIWALTPNGAALALKIAGMLEESPDVYLSENLSIEDSSCFFFQRLLDSVSDMFHVYGRHIFIMSTGIVIRVTAHLLKHKTVDPAVVVVDEKGRFSISLLSGHIGGANRLAHRIAETIGAQPVITTATDVQQITAIDVLATEGNLVVETPSAIKYVSMALLKGEKIRLHDPYDLLKDRILKSRIDDCAADMSIIESTDFLNNEFTDAIPGVFVDDRNVRLPPEILILRPKSLSAGIGCNRNTEMAEIKSLLLRTLEDFGLAYQSLRELATIDIKQDEPGLNDLSTEIGIPIRYFSKQALNSVQNIRQSSPAAEKYIGVKSVCEASAILASQNGQLIVPKQKTGNVTVAIARTAFLS